MFMSLSKAVRHTIIQLAGKSFSTLFGILALAVLTRYLGQEQFGWYTTITVFLQFFGILADFGLTLITAQMLSEPGADEEKITSNIFSLRLLISVIFFGSALVLVWFFPYPTDIKWGVWIYAASLFAVTLQNIFVGFYQKRTEMERVAWGDVLGRGLILGGYLVAAVLKLNILLIMAVSVIANLAQLALLWQGVSKYIKVRLVFEKQVYREVLCRSWPVAVSIAFNLLYLKADTLILSVVRPQAEVGLYGAAYRVIDVLTTVPTIFMGIMLPLLTAAWSGKNQEMFAKYFRRSFDLMAVLGWPLLIGGVLLSTRTMLFLAGGEFVASGNYLRILLLAMFCIFFGVVSAHAILSLNKQKQMIKWYLVDAVLSLIGYFIFIPRFGAYAAAWVTVFSEAFIMIITYVVVIQTSRVWPKLSVTFKSLVASLVMAGVIVVLQSFNFILIFLAAVLIYFLVLFLLRGITQEMIKNIVKAN